MEAWITVTCLLLLSVLGVFSDLTYRVPESGLEGSPSPRGSPWPSPETLITFSEQLILNLDSFDITSNADACDVIGLATKRYRGLIIAGTRTRRLPGMALLSGLSVKVEKFEGDDCGYPGHMEDESYRLVVPRGGAGNASVQSRTVWGALRGLETFSQLVHYADYYGTYVINRTEIFDHPKYEFRSVMLDSSKHFLPVHVIKQNLDAMAYNKFNVFHWHLVDDESWPLELSTYPNLTKAAYGSRFVYKKEDVGDIVEHAKLRGIRVIPEICTPGHSKALGKAFPDLMMPCYRNRTDAPTTLNPTLNRTYEVVGKILEEVADMFKDPYIHLGMLDIPDGCWSGPRFQPFMQEQGLDDERQVKQYYARRIMDRVKAFGSKSMIWGSIDGVQVDDDTVVVSMGSRPLSVNGKRFQLVDTSCWNLSDIHYEGDWRTYYTCGVLVSSAGQNTEGLLIGGETALWGDHFDATNLIATVWRGIAAQPIYNGFCHETAWGEEDQCRTL